MSGKLPQIVILVEDQDQVDIIQNVLEQAENEGLIDISFDFMVNP